MEVNKTQDKIIVFIRSFVGAQGSWTKRTTADGEITARVSAGTWLPYAHSRQVASRFLHQRVHPNLPGLREPLRLLDWSSRLLRSHCCRGGTIYTYTSLPPTRPPAFFFLSSNLSQNFLTLLQIDHHLSELAKVLTYLLYILCSKLYHQISLIILSSLYIL